MLTIAINKATFALAVCTLILLPNALAQGGAPGCGAPDVKFEVKTVKQQPAVKPDPGKALLFFIEDDSSFDSHPKPTTRLGVDGRWEGATHGSSYLFPFLDPGVHHLCASWQSLVVLGLGHKTLAAHFTAEPGEVYYFSAKANWLLHDGFTGMTLDPLDSDEGQLLASKLKFSVSKEKK